MIKLNIIKNEATCIEAAIVGELDTQAVHDFNLQSQALLNESSKEILFDFAALQYISSAGMRVLLQINKEATLHGGKVSIKNMSADIRQIFEMTGFDRILNIV